MQWIFRLGAGVVVGVALVMVPALAQVRCTMPNGVVIAQHLSDVCPQGAVRAETMDGGRAEIRGLAPPQPLRRGAAGDAVQTVSRAEFGARWPLTVDSVELRCVAHSPSLSALVFAHNSQIFTLNGIAAGQAKKMGWQAMGALWRDNPDIEGTKIPITPLIQRADSLCGAVVPAEVKAAPAPAPASASDDDGLSFFGWLVVLGGVAALIAAMRGSAAQAARKR